MLKQLLAIVLIVALQVKAQEVEKLEFDVEKAEELSTSTKTYKFVVSDSEISSNKFVTLTTTPTSNLNPAQFYISKETQEPSVSNHEFFSQKPGSNFFFIPANKLSAADYYVTVNCKTNCNYKILLSLQEKISIKPNEESIEFVPQNENKIEINVEDFQDSVVSVVSYSNNNNDFTMSVDIEGIKIEKVLENGFGAIVNLKNHKVKSFTVTITTTSEKNIIGVGAIDLSGKKNEIYPYEKVYGYFYNENTVDKKKCYDVIFDTNKSIKMRFNANAFSQSLLVSFFKDSESVLENVIFFNNYIFIDAIDFNKVCIENFDNSDSMYVSYVFQLVYANDVENQAFQSQTFPGTQSIRSLESNEVIYYRHNAPDGSPVTANIISISGKAVLYYHKCETFPECSYDSDKVDKLIESNLITLGNKFNKERYYFESSENKDIDSNIQNLFIVRCESQEQCKYLITISAKDDPIFLLPDIDYNLLVKGTQLFSLRLFNTNIIKSIQLSLSNLVGNVNLKIFKDKQLTTDGEFEFSFADGLEIFSKNKDITSEYYIQASSINEISLVTIGFQLNGVKKKTLINSMINIINISPFESGKTYSIINSNNDPMTIILTSLNCDFSTKLEETSYDKTTFIQHDFAEPKEETTFTLKTDSQKIINGTYCTVLVTPVIQGDSLFLNEGVERSTLLNYATEKVDYKFPFIYNDDSVIEVDFKKNVGDGIKVQISADEGKNYIIDKEYFSSERFIIDSKKIGSACEVGKICIINLTLSKTDKSCSFSIVVRNNKNKVPQYLIKNSFVKDNLSSKTIKYYYNGEISKDEEGEIMVDFVKGSGKVYAKFVDNSVIEENANWNGHIRLPDESDPDILDYDIKKKKIAYTAAHTSKCSKNCEIYIGIDPSDSETNIALSVVSSDSPIKISTNELIASSLENEYKYYTLTIPMIDTKRIIITFVASNSGEMYINEGSVSPSSKEHKYRLQSGDLLEIQEEPSNSLMNKKYSISVYCENASTYNFKISPQYRDFRILKVSPGDQSITCSRKDDNYCLGYTDTANIKNDLYYAVKGNKEFNYVLLANFVDKKLLDSGYDKSLAEIVPTTENKTYSSTNGFLFISKEDIESNENKYLLVKPESESDELIRLFISDISEGTTTLNKEEEKLINFVNEKSILKIIDDSENNSTYLISSKDIDTDDVGTIENESTNMTISTEGFNVFDVAKNQEIKINKKDKNSRLALILRCLGSRNSLDNFENIETNKQNKIIYSKDQFPLTVYSEKKKAESLYDFYIKFDSKYSQEEKNKDSFQINGYVVNNEFIKKRIADKTATPETPPVLGKYLSFENVGVLSGVKTNEVNEISYIYVNIQNKSDIAYQSISSNMLTYEVGEQYPLLTAKQYFYGILSTNKTKLSFEIKSEKDKKFIYIEISESVNTRYNKLYPKIAFEEKANEVSLKNTTSSVKELDSSDKRYAIFKVNEKSSYILSIYSPETQPLSDEHSIEFVVKYKLMSDVKDFKEVKIDKVTLVEKTQDMLNVTFKPISDKKIKDTRYYLQFYSSPDPNATKIDDLFDSICSNFDDKSLIPKGESIFKEGSSSYLYELNITGKVYARLLVKGVDDEGEEFLAGSDNFFDKEGKGPSTSSKWWIWLIVALLVIILLVVGVLLFTRKKKEDKPEEKIENTQNMSLI